MSDLDGTYRFKTVLLSAFSCDAEPIKLEEQMGSAEFGSLHVNTDVY